MRREVESLLAKRGDPLFDRPVPGQASFEATNRDAVTVKRDGRVARVWPHRELAHRTALPFQLRLPVQDYDDRCW